MTLKVKKYHDCSTIQPSMIVSQEVVEHSSGWWIFKQRWNETVTIYEKSDAEWECPVCHSVYHWDGHFFKQWRAKSRTSEWVEVNEENYQKPLTS